MMALNDIEKQLQEAKTKVTELENQREQFLALSPESQLALVLHAKFCRWNHQDSCSWHHEIHNGVHDWKGIAHLVYLRRAAEVLAHPDIAGNVAKAMRLAEVFEKVR